MSFRNAVLRDRYTAFEEYRNVSPFYDEELSSHIVLDFNNVMASLKSTSLSSNRKKSQFESVKGCPFAAPLIEFYGQWLMYMDGDAHFEARKLISVALSKAGRNIGDIVETSFTKHLNILRANNVADYDLISTFSAPFVTSVLAKIFGISPARYEEIIDTSKPIVNFLGNGDAGDEIQRRSVAMSLIKTNELLVKCIKECCDSESVIGYLINKDVAVETISPLLINIVIDGYDPLLAAINTFLLKFSQNLSFISDEKINANQIFEEIVRLETPFQYCARIATEDFYLGDYKINRGDRVMSFISAANRDPKYFPNPNNLILRENKYKNISFGAGGHVCPGGNLTKKISTQFFNLMFSTFNEMNVIHIEDKWMDSFGFRLLTNLKVKIEFKELETA